MFEISISYRKFLNQRKLINDMWHCNHTVIFILREKLLFLTLSYENFEVLSRYKKINLEINCILTGKSLNAAGKKSIDLSKNIRKATLNTVQRLVKIRES